MKKSYVIALHKRADNTLQIMLLLHMQIRRYFNEICDKLNYRMVSLLILEISLCEIKTQMHKLLLVNKVDI
jgi:hypothetical protein